MQNFVLANISYGTLECVDPVPLSCTNRKVSTHVLHYVSQKCIPENNYHPKVGQKWLCIPLLHSYITLGLHEDPMFSIHSLAHTESSCLLCCHHYIMPCDGVRACALILSCLRAHQFQHLLYYCTFILVNPNVFGLGFSQQRNKVYHRVGRLYK